MILSCPSCKTRYIVPDSAIGPTGRRVRCANCRFSWVQDPPALDLDTAPSAEEAARELPVPAPPAPAPRQEEPAPPPSWTRQEPEPEAAPEPEPVEDWEPPRKPRRNRARLWTVLAVIFALLMVGAVVALQVFGLPEPIRRIFMAEQNPNVLTLRGRVHRSRLASGQDLLILRGEITNTSDETQRLPQVRAELRDAQGNTVYSWSIAPPVRELGPRETRRFDSAERDVPINGQVLSLNFGPVS